MRLTPSRLKIAALIVVSGTLALTVSPVHAQFNNPSSFGGGMTGGTGTGGTSLFGGSSGFGGTSNSGGASSIFGTSAQSRTGGMTSPNSQTGQFGNTTNGMGSMQGMGQGQGNFQSGSGNLLRTAVGMDVLSGGALSGGGMTGGTMATMSMPGMGGMGRTNMGRMQFGQQGQFGQMGQQGGQQNSRSKLKFPMRPAFAISATASSETARKFVNRLGSIPGMANVRGVNINMVGNTAVLTGVVESADQADLIERLAKLEPGIWEVQNDLQVAPGDSQTGPNSLPIPPPLTSP